MAAAADSDKGERLLGAVIDLCNGLGVATIAEHIESEQQLKLLLKLGCRYGQGFWLHQPLTAGEVRVLSSSVNTAASVRVRDPRRSAA